MLTVFIVQTFLFANIGIAQQELKINCTIHSPTEVLFVRLLEEIAKRNNFSISRQTPPVGRSLINVNEGIDDGDGPRIEGLEEKYPNLVRVSESFGVFRFVAFSKDPTIQINGWKSLESYNVAYIHGWKIFDQHLPKAKSIVKVKNKELLFSLLDKNRTDLVLITKLAGQETIQRMNLQGIIVPLQPPLAVKPMYLYLNKKHMALLPYFNKTLQEIKRDGTYLRFNEEILRPFVTKSSSN